MAVFFTVSVIQFLGVTHKLILGSTVVKWGKRGTINFITEK